MSEEIIPVKVYINSDISDLVQPPEDVTEHANPGIPSLPDEEDGDAVEHIRYITTGEIRISDRHCSISYSERADMGFENASTTLFFHPEQPQVITMVRTGDTSAVIRFDPGMPRQMVNYDTGYFPVEFAISTRSIHNTVTRVGGEMQLDYVIEMHGIKTERNLFRIRIRPTEGGEPERVSP